MSDVLEHFHGHEKPEQRNASNRQKGCGFCASQASNQRFGEEAGRSPSYWVPGCACFSFAF